MNWASIREQFPVTRDYVFFDLANKCPLPLFSTAVIEDYIRKQQESGGSKAEWFSTLENARNSFAAMIKANPTEIAFTKNTSEGLNIAANCLPLNPGDTVLLNYNEHPNNIYCWLNLEKRGVKVKWIPTHRGEVRLQDVMEMTDSSTRAISLSSVTFAPGNRNDIEAIAAFCRSQGIFTVVDAVQTVGTLELDIRNWSVDILCASGHKALMCPHGVGLLYVREGILDSIHPIYVARSGMGMAAQVEYDERDYELVQAPTAKKFEIGNYNYLGITVLDNTLKYLAGIGMQVVEERILEINSYLIQELLRLGVKVASPISGPSRTAIVCFEAKNARRLYEYLTEHRAITTLRKEMIRISLGIYNDTSDVDKFIRLLEEYRKIDPEGV